MTLQPNLGLGLFNPAPPEILNSGDVDLRCTIQKCLYNIMGWRSVKHNNV